MAKAGKRLSGKTEKALAEAEEIRFAKKAKKRAKQEKRAERILADKARFQRSDRKSISSIVGNRDADVSAPISKEPVIPVAGIMPRKGMKPLQSRIRQDLARNASFVLSLAAGVFILMGMLVAAKVAGAEDALRAFGGNFMQAPQNLVPDIFRLVLLMDTLFPMLLGAGFAMLLSSVQERGNRPLVRLALTAVLVGVLADFTENALVFSGLQDNTVSPFQIIFSILKYGMFALAAVLASVLVPIRGGMGWLVKLFLLFVFPFAAALSICKIGAINVFGIEEKMITAFIGVVFLVTILSLAIYAALLSEDDKSEDQNA